MNLHDLIASHPTLFYGQTWYAGEDFMLNANHSLGMVIKPPQPHLHGPSCMGSPSALILAMNYVLNPRDPVWRNFIWTSDTDHHGQRIYVGGVSDANGNRFEIHRHLAITDKWVNVKWS